jgi:ABC-type multidrug transport system ATPase subunit
VLLVKELKLLTGKSVSLELTKGQGYVLQGSNGIGKTVLLRTVAGIYSAEYSVFTFHGKDVASYRAEEFRSRILYVGSTTHMIAEMTSEEFINAPLRLEIYRGHKSDILVNDYLKKWHLAGKKMAHLSSGQKQLLILLRALTLKGELLLLDEPTSHMDPERTAEAESLIQSWITPERSYLLVSHSVAQAERLGTKIGFKDLLT